MVSGNMFMHVIDCMKMRIQSGTCRHTLGLWCTGSAMIVQRYTLYNYYAYAFLEFISSKLNSSSHWSRLIALYIFEGLSKKFVECLYKIKTL